MLPSHSQVYIIGKHSTVIYQPHALPDVGAGDDGVAGVGVGTGFTDELAA